jgi:Kdo2-lipid IVA lauroyltransferase/acyltransferase
MLPSMKHPLIVKLILAPLLLFSSAINLLGLRGLTIAGSALGSILYTLGFRMKIVMANLELAYGKEKTPAEIEKLARAIYKNTGILFLEIARNFSMTKAQMLQELEVSPEDFKKIEEISSRGKGMIVISSHHANWELFAMGMAGHGCPVSIVVKKMSSPAAQELIEQRRARTGLGIIYPGGTLQRMAEALKDNRMIGFMVDQHINGARGVRANFFGTPAASIRGLANLVKDTGAPVIPMCAFRLPNGKHRVQIFDEVPYVKVTDLPEGSPEQVLREEWVNTQNYQTAIEEIVRMKPEQWLWIHRRWKADRTPFDPATIHLAPPIKF